MSDQAKAIQFIDGPLTPTGPVTDDFRAGWDAAFEEAQMVASVYVLQQGKASDVLVTREYAAAVIVLDRMFKRREEIEARMETKE